MKKKQVKGASVQHFTDCTLKCNSINYAEQSRAEQRISTWSIQIAKSAHESPKLIAIGFECCLWSDKAYELIRLELQWIYRKTVHCRSSEISKLAKFFSIATFSLVIGQVCVAS